MAIKKKMAKCWVGGHTCPRKLADVEILAEAKGYAMVRRPGAVPFVRPIDELLPTTATADSIRKVLE